MDKWTPEEDRKLVELRNQKKSFKECSTSFVGRSPRACDTRYNRYLKEGATARKGGGQSGK